MTDQDPQHRAGDPPQDGDVVGTHYLMLSNSAYDKTKFAAQILLPGIGALYFALAQIWGLPAAEQVVGSITAVDVFLGLFLGAAGKQYQDATEGPTVGFLNVSKTEEGGKHVELEFPGDPVDIDKNDKVTFKVRKV